MGLREIDSPVFLFVPKSLWDVSCNHYHSCLHELGWQQYCYSVIDHFSQVPEIITHHKDKIHELDLLDLMIWSIYNTNVMVLISEFYTGLSVDYITKQLHLDREIFRAKFAKYLKVYETQTKQ